MQTTLMIPNKKLMLAPGFIVLIGSACSKDITGLVMALNWFQDGLYTLTGGDLEYAGFEYPKNISAPSLEAESATDAAPSKIKM